MRAVCMPHPLAAFSTDNHTSGPSPLWMGTLRCSRAFQSWSGVNTRSSRRAGSCRSTGGSILREVLTNSQRSKLDATDDRQFYDVPRLVTHVDDAFIRQVTELYRQRIPKDAAVLDLCSSWISHLPSEVSYSRVVGHGLNAAELARNKRLDSFFVRDLNKEPDGWALESNSMDAVLCCVSVQYMQQPERVFAEVYRVLKPGGVLIITFSNRMFYSKAIAAWRDESGWGRCQLVRSYIQAVAGFTQPEVLTEVAVKPHAPSVADALLDLFKPLTQLVQRSSSDPFYAVVTYRNLKPDYS